MKHCKAPLAVACTLITTLTIGACSFLPSDKDATSAETDSNPKKTATDTAEETGQTAAKQSEAVDIKLYVFECGNITVNDISLFSPGVDEGKVKELTDSCYLIRHPKGDMIWDTGVSDQVGEAGISAVGGKIEMNVTHPLAEQLDDIDVSPEDIQYLGISHFHSDHTGNANYFKNASLIIQNEEYNAAFGPTPDQYGFNPTSYSALNRDKMTIIQGDHDVFGDGSVTVRRATGHTPGHQMLLVKLKNAGPILLSGDLYHFTSNRTHKRVPSFNYNKEDTLASMEKMEAFMDKTGTLLWIQHDKEHNATLKHSPEYYD